MNTKSPNFLRLSFFGGRTRSDFSGVFAKFLAGEMTPNEAAIKAPIPTKSEGVCAPPSVRKVTQWVGAILYGRPARDLRRYGKSMEASFERISH